MALDEGEVVLCTVKRVQGTTVFVEIENENIEGTISFSEVSPGRIRNIREYVVPNKRIVCKVLRIKSGHPELTLRRVTSKEREEVTDAYKKERILNNMLKTVLKEKSSLVLEKIKQKYDIPEFLEELREKPDSIEKFVTKKEGEELKKIFASSKQAKEKEVIREIKLTSQNPEGLSDIKKSLSVKDLEISYLGSSKFSLKVKAKDYKKANTIMDKAIEEIKENSKKHSVKLEIKESKK